MAYPADKQTLGTSFTNSTVSEDNHPNNHNDLGTIANSLQDKVGIDLSADTSSLDYQLNNASSVSPGHKHALNDNTDVDTTGAADGNVFIYEGASGKWKPADTDAPDASTTVNGVSRVSVAPASATIPISVGDNDPRVPSQDENDALVGTSGTPSTSNKYVTNDDTATSGANKVLRLDANGDIPSAVDVQTFTASGTWTKPTVATKVLVQAWGAGGSGANDAAQAAGGGGGGAYFEQWFDASDLGATETVTIGAGGAAVTASATNGNDGADTTFGSLLTAGAGKGGIRNSPPGDGTGGDGGSVYATAASFWGTGGVETVGGAGIYSGGGGGGTFNTDSFAGGASKLGGAGGGGSHSGGAASGGTSVSGGNGGAGAYNGNATAGTQPGGGGGANSGTGDSGAGADGQMIVTTFK